MTASAPGLPESVGLAVFFVVGLLGGTRCLGMCGPPVTAYAGRSGGRRDALSMGIAATGVGLPRFPVPSCDLR